jgi:hypothetical protein
LADGDSLSIRTNVRQKKGSMLTKTGNGRITTMAIDQLQIIAKATSRAEVGGSSARDAW